MSTPTDTTDNTEGGTAMTVTTSTDVQIKVSDELALTTNQRCDRCGGQAYVEVQVPEGSELLFCGHHYHQHEDKIKALATVILDYRTALTKRPTEAGMT